MHFHNFGPIEVVNDATRQGLSVREWLTKAKAASADSVPGTAAEILDDGVRGIRTNGKLPTTSWIDVASRLGVTRDATVRIRVDSLIPHPRHWDTLRALGVPKELMASP